MIDPDKPHSPAVCLRIGCRRSSSHWLHTTTPRQVEPIRWSDIKKKIQDSGAVQVQIEGMN